jgi:hypothetical protein
MWSLAILQVRRNVRSNDVAQVTYTQGTVTIPSCDAIQRMIQTMSIPVDFIHPHMRLAQHHRWLVGWEVTTNVHRRIGMVVGIAIIQTLLTICMHAVTPRALGRLGIVPARRSPSTRFTHTVTNRLLPDCLTTRTVVGVTTTLGTVTTARGTTANIAAHVAVTRSLGAASVQ